MASTAVPDYFSTNEDSLVTTNACTRCGHSARFHAADGCIATRCKCKTSASARRYFRPKTRTLKEQSPDEA